MPHQEDEVAVVRIEELALGFVRVLGMLALPLRMRIHDVLDGQLGVISQVGLPLLHGKLFFVLDAVP